MAMRWVLRVGRVEVSRGGEEVSEAERSGEVDGVVKRVRGVCGQSGVLAGGSLSSWDEKSRRLLGWGSKE